MQLSVQRRPDSGVPVVAVTGDVDIHSAPQLRESIAAALSAGAKRVVVDLSGVDFLDSTALGALVDAHAAAADRDAALPLVCTRARLLKLFAITGLDGAFEFAPSVEAALAGT